MKRREMAAIFAGWMSVTTVHAAAGGDFDSIAIEIRAKNLVAHGAANLPLDQSAHAEADRLLALAAHLQERAESGALRISPIRLRSLERAIEALRDRVAASDALASSQIALVTATIQGHVYPAPATAGVVVKAFDFSGKTKVAQATVAADGSYSFSVPAPGTYTLKAINGATTNFIAQYLGGMNCEGNFGANSYYLGNMLKVASDGTVTEVTPSGATASGFDFTLLTGGSISGTVLSGGSPVVGANVYADFGSGSGAACSSPGITDGFGNFVIRGLPTQSVVVYVDGSSGSPVVQDTEYPNVPCGEADCSIGPNTYVQVTEGSNTALPTQITAGTPSSGISGTVHDAATNLPIAGAAISLISEDGWTYDSGNVFTDASGNYTFAQVRPTNYRVLASAPGYIGGVYRSPTVTLPCVDPTTCDPIAIGGRVTLGAGDNLYLSKGASVSGTVTRASDLSPVTGATVTFTNFSATVVSPATDASGNYTVTGLPDGNYTVYASLPTASASLNLAPTGLAGSACEGDANPSTCTGPKLAVSAAAPRTGVNIAMAAGGAVTGLITDGSSGAPNPYNGGGHSRIELLDTNGQQAIVADQTSASGYALYGVAPGTYTPIFTTSSFVGWIDIAADGTPCPRRSCNLTVLSTITVSAATPIIQNVTMPRGALITGVVTDAATGKPILQPGFDPSFNNSIIVIANPPYGGGFGNPDGSGVYGTRQGFASGNYHSSTVFDVAGAGSAFFQPFGAGYIDQAYNSSAGIACPDMTCNLAGATSISVTGTAPVTGINYVLSKGGSVTGTVTDTSANPLGYVELSAFDSAGKLVAQALSNALGGFNLRGLPSGNYYVATANALGTLGYIDQVYSGFACTPTCNPASGTPVSVTAPSVTSGVNFSLLRDRIFSNGFEPVP